MRTKLEITADGSHTLFVPELDEHYHSVNGAKQESAHIFINTGLHHLSSLEKVSIFEVGFGTGLNAFLTFLDSLESKKKISYTSIEAYPISSEIVSQLNFATNEIERKYFNKLHQAEWDSDIEMLENFKLKKLEADFTTFDFSRLNDIDLVYFDAFAPEKQEAMWHVNLFEALYKIMNKGGVLVTYCAKGIIRRMMQEVGFTVERLPGPPGKREMLRATK